MKFINILDAIGPPTIEQSSIQIHRELGSDPQPILCTWALAVALIIGGAVHLSIFPFWRVLMRLVFDYGSMFQLSDWRFQCCAAKSVNRKLASGFCHPAGFDKWTWDLFAHSVSGSLCFLSVITDKTQFALWGIILNTATCDWNDILKWIFAKKSTPKDSFWCCSNRNAPNPIKYYMEHSLLVALVLHHLSSMICMMIVLYFRLYKVTFVQWVYFLIMIPGSVPIVISGMCINFIKPLILAQYVLLISGCCTHHVRFESVYIAAVELGEFACPIWWNTYILRPMQGLALFSLFGTMQAASTINSFVPERRAMPSINDEFPLAVRNFNQRCRSALPKRAPEHDSATPPTVCSPYNTNDL